MPIAQTYNALGGTGTVTFDKPLDQTVVLDPSDWFRGLGSQRRLATSMSYASPTVVSIDSLSVAAGSGFPAGWSYTPGAAPIRGTDGVEVAAFSEFLG